MREGQIKVFSNDQQQHFLVQRSQASSCKTLIPNTCWTWRFYNSTIIQFRSLKRMTCSLIDKVLNDFFAHARKSSSYQFIKASWLRKFVHDKEADNKQTFLFSFKQCLIPLTSHILYAGWTEAVDETCKLFFIKIVVCLLGKIGATHWFYACQPEFMNRLQVIDNKDMYVSLVFNRCFAVICRAFSLIQGSRSNLVSHDLQFFIINYKHYLSPQKYRSRCQWYCKTHLSMTVLQKRNRFQVYGNLNDLIL